VRVVDYDGSQAGVMPTSAALNLAQQRGMDLIEVAPQAVPPVCRICDYGKYKYELEKKEKQAKRHQSQTKVKEVKFHSNVEDHDFITKCRHIREFLAENFRVKVSLMFRGREQAHTELGYQVMSRVSKELQDVGITERSPEQMGRFLFMMISPRPAVRQQVKPAAGSPTA
jgi:translation initiation factor IF-3